MRASATIPALLYILMAGAILWPAAPFSGDWAPGGQWTDVWNSIWSMNFAHQSVMSGRLPWFTQALGHPTGGTVLLPDFWGGLFAVLTVGFVGATSAFTAWITIQLALTGWITHLFASEWLQVCGLERDHAQRAAWVAGIGHMASPVTLAGAQCGTTEAVSGGWLALGVWAAWRASRTHTTQRILLAGMALWAATLAGWYTTSIVFIFAAVLGISKAPERGIRALFPLALGLIFAIPFAIWTHTIHSDPSHLASRAPGVIDHIRASFGAATPLGMLWPIDKANIAIGHASDLGQGYLHTGYLGLTLVAAAIVGIFRQVPNTVSWVTAGLTTAILSWGPGSDGQLPYALIESLPGASNLSLVWRLAGGAALAVALLAAAASQGQRRIVLILVLFFCADVRWFSPITPGVAVASVKPNTALSSMAEEPPGAVLTLPVQHKELWLQTQHQHPITGGINVRRSPTAQRWIDSTQAGDWEESKQEAQAFGLRYLAVRQSPRLRVSSDRHLAHRLAHQETPLVSAGRWTIYKLW